MTDATVWIGTRELRLIADTIDVLGLERGHGHGDVLLGLWKAAYLAGAADERKRWQDKLRFDARDLANLADTP